MEINEIISWLIQLIIGTIITSFAVAILHTRSERKRIAENAETRDEFRKHSIDGCSAHITNRLKITGEKINESGDLNISFSSPVIDQVSGDYKNDHTISVNTINVRNFTLPTSENRYTIEIKSKNNKPLRYSIEYEWEGTDLTKYLLSKLKNILNR